MAARMLTAAAVARLKPGTQRIEIKDAGAPGLYLVIQASGARSWAVRFRRPGDRKHSKLTLGPVDLSGHETAGEPVIGMPLSLSAARRLAADVQRQRALGRDVIADRNAERQRRRIEVEQRAENSFAAAVRAFIEQHAKPKVRRWPEIARLLGLWPEDGAVIPGGLVDRWGDRVVTEISADDIDALIEQCKRSGVPGLKRRKRGSAESRSRKMFGALSKLFSFTRATRRANPCRSADRPATPRARDRKFTDQELRWFWTATASIGEPFGTLLRLLVATGLRRDELRCATVHELRDAGRTLVLPKERTKNHREHIVALSLLAQELLAGVERVPGKPGYLFTTTGHSPVSGFSKTKRRLDAAMLALAKAEGCDSFPAWKVHDLRRVAVSGMARAGADLPVIEKAINHASGSFAGVVAVYQQHQFEAEIRAAVEAWANLLRSIVEPGVSGNIVSIRGQR
jgi:integrase